MCVDCAIGATIDAVFDLVNFKSFPQVARHRLWVEQTRKVHRDEKRLHPTARAMRYTPPPNVPKIRNPSVPIAALFKICRLASIWR